MADTRIIPPALSQSERLSQIAQLAMDEFDIDPTPVMTNLFATAPAAILNELAVQWGLAGAGGWDFVVSDDDKRALLAEAIKLARSRGTKSSMMRALALLGVVATIDEWWQEAPVGDVNFPRDPYRFRILLSTMIDGDTRLLDDARVARLRPFIDFWKPARSHYSLATSSSGGAGISITPIGTAWLLCTGLGSVSTRSTGAQGAI